MIAETGVMEKMRQGTPRIELHLSTGSGPAALQ
jgi:hypothetical protein